MNDPFIKMTSTDYKNIKIGDIVYYRSFLSHTSMMMKSGKVTGFLDCECHYSGCNNKVIVDDNKTDGCWFSGSNCLLYKSNDFIDKEEFEV